MPTAKLGDVELYYEVHGSGPLLLNISGSGSDLRNFPPGKDPLTKKFTVLSYDHRGTGQSPASIDHNSQPTMRTFADEGVALAKSLGWDRCHVLGTSFGGMVALELVLRNPEFVDKLVLRCTSPGGSMPSYPLHELGHLTGSERVEVLLGLTDSRYDPDAEDEVPNLGAYVKMMRAGASRPPDPALLAGARQQLEARRHHNVQDRLAAIQNETLLCAGSYDLLAPMANMEALAEGIPNSTLRVFDGGHAFMLQDVNAGPAVRAFLLGQD